MPSPGGALAPRRGSDPSTPPPDHGERMYFGLIIFIVLAILMVFAFIKVKRKDRAYGRGEDD